MKWYDVKTYDMCQCELKKDYTFDIQKQITIGHCLQYYHLLFSCAFEYKVKKYILSLTQ